MKKMNMMSTGGVYGKSTGQKPALYLCCDYCSKTMDKSWVCVWQEDADGKSHDVTLLHYHCREQFEEDHKGKWFSRGMPARSIT